MSNGAARTAGRGCGVAVVVVGGNGRVGVEEEVVVGKRSSAPVSRQCSRDTPYVVQHPHECRPTFIPTWPSMCPIHHGLFDARFISPRLIICHSPLRP